MQIEELHQLSLWIDNEIVKSQIILKFDSLFNIINANVRRVNNQPVQPFEDQKNNLILAITAININSLTLSQLQILDVLKIKNHIGDLGKKNIEDLFLNNIDIAHVANQISVMKTEIQQGIQISNATKVALQPIIPDSKIEIDSDKVRTRVIFDNDAAIGNIINLKEWSSKWFDIGRGFSMANGQAPESMEVIGAAKGSLIIELAILATTALPIAKAIQLTLDSLVKYRDYQLKSAEVRKMKSDSPKIAEDLEEDAKRWEIRAQELKHDIADDVTEDVKQFFDDYKEENQAELGKAVRTLVDFLSKGGDVDCVIDDIQEESSETLISLKNDFVRIRELKEVLLLDHKKL